MIVTIQGQRQTLKSIEFKIDKPSRIQLKPNEIYTLRIYIDLSVSAKDGIFGEEEIVLNPIERDNLVVLQFFRYPDKNSFEPKLPQHAGLLLLRAEFKVDNDSLFPKIIRWAFRIEKNPLRTEAIHVLQGVNTERSLSYRTCRISLLVAPRFHKKILFIVSIIGTIFIAEFYDFFTEKMFQSTSEWGSWFFHQFLIYFVLALILLLVLSIYGVIMSRFNTGDF
ncbi:MAG: hypothetical protein AABZ60_01420 [Planctomycetota bacterium]